MSSPKRSSDSEAYSESKDLPIELLPVIAKRLTSIIDYISFRGVCRSWRSAATLDNFYRAFPRVPWLMYVDVKRVTNFLDLPTKTYRITDFPPAVGIPYLSWSGWILYLLNNCVDVNLTHPIWRIKIELPSLDTFPAFARLGGIYDRVIRKMVLSGSPTIKTDLLVMVIWGNQNQLGFSRPGDSSWTLMASWDGSFCDIIYHNRRLYAVDSRVRVVACDVHGPNPTQILQVFVLPNFDLYLSFSGVMYYLVESSGKFLIVSRHFIGYKTMAFRIFEFDLMDGSHNEIHQLGNRALFLGFNSSICLELSAWSNVKPNHIYFTDHFGQSTDLDTGVYKLLNKSIEGFFGEFRGFIFSPPIWVVPSL